MKQPRTAYELSQSQVSTPPAVIRQFWEIVHERRPKLNKVLDLGAGDGRFGKGSRASAYVGIEIDPAKAKVAVVPKNGRMIIGCAFNHKVTNYDACIGNPPYVRHHDLESPWRERIAKGIQEELGIRLNQKSNLFLYFLCLGLLKTSTTGLVALLVPFEWISRPSSAPIREYLRNKGWKVEVYRYKDNIFDSVLTTASVTLIDKAEKAKKWSYFDLSSKNSIQSRRSVSAAVGAVLPYSDRGEIWAMRGMSPGSQRIFCLTEGERIHFGLRKRDVVPCVTSLRHVPREILSLTPVAFQNYYVDAGERCWLVKSFGSVLSSHVRNYLSGVPREAHDNYTCNSRRPWYRFPLHPTPKLLISSGFTSFGPKVIKNPIKAHAVGGVTGIHFDKQGLVNRTQDRLLNFEFEKHVVAHAKTLRKIEIRQLNAALKQLDYAS